MPIYRSGPMRVCVNDWALGEIPYGIGQSANSLEFNNSKVDTPYDPFWRELDEQEYQRKLRLHEQELYQKIELHRALLEYNRLQSKIDECAMACEIVSNSNKVGDKMPTKNDLKSGDIVAVEWAPKSNPDYKEITNYLIIRTEIATSTVQGTMVRPGGFNNLIHLNEDLKIGNDHTIVKIWKPKGLLVELPDVDIPLRTHEVYWEIDREWKALTDKHVFHEYKIQDKTHVLLRHKNYESLIILCTETPYRDIRKLCAQNNWLTENAVIQAFDRLDEYNAKN